MTNCEACGVAIANEWEAYGNVGETLCMDCWYDMIDLEELERGYSEVYGIAPHHHDLSITGNIIGSTVDDPLPTATDKVGWYTIAPGVLYMPDPNPDGAGMGMWRYYHDALYDL